MAIQIGNSEKDGCISPSNCFDANVSSCLQRLSGEIADDTIRARGITAEKIDICSGIATARASTYSVVR